MSQSMLARAAGISVENVKRIEKHKVVGINAETVEPLASALQIPIEEFRRDYMRPDGAISIMSPAEEDMLVIEELLHDNKKMTLAEAMKKVNWYREQRAAAKKKRAAPK